MDLALAHPDHVAGLVLVAPSASGYPEEERVSAAAELEQDAMIEQAGDAGDLAHCPSLDQPDEPNRLVLEFAKSIEAWSSETS